VRVGTDLVLTIWGGTVPHVGAVALAQARPSLADPGVASATSSVLTLLGHKDDVVAREAADRFAAALGSTVVATAGLHVDAATPEEIQTLIATARCCLDQLLGEVMTD